MIYRAIIGRYRAIYRPIFQIPAIFCSERYGERFPRIVSATFQKGDIGQDLGRYLKQGEQLINLVTISISVYF